MASPYNPEYYQKTKHKYLARQRRYKRKNRAKISERQREYRKKYPNIMKRSYLKNVYGLDFKRFKKMLKTQKHRCALCYTHKSKLPRGLAVDHCHKTDKVRGLLCFSCNSALGLAKDDCNLLKRMIKYLKKHDEDYGLER